MSLRAELICDARAELAEGPVWHDGALWWVNINIGTLNRLDPATGINTSRATGDFLGAAVPDAQDRWLLARRHEVARLDWRSGTITPLAALPDPDPRLRFNDGKCDPRGRFFAGTMHRDVVPGRAAFYRLAAGRLELQFDGVTISNGLDWSPDGTRLYYTDTMTGRVDVFEYDLESGALRGRQPLVTLPEKRGWPDGLCCDVNGNVWLALWDGGCVECFDGRTGRSLERVYVPARRVSSCCFGGNDYNCLYITTAWEDYDKAARDADPLAGGIFAIHPGVSGRPAFRLAPGQEPASQKQ